MNQAAVDIEWGMLSERNECCGKYIMNPLKNVHSGYQVTPERQECKPKSENATLGRKFTFKEIYPAPLMKFTKECIRCHRKGIKMSLAEPGTCYDCRNGRLLVSKAAPSTWVAKGPVLKLVAVSPSTRPHKRKFSEISRSTQGADLTTISTMGQCFRCQSQEFDFLSATANHDGICHECHLADCRKQGHDRRMAEAKMANDRPKALVVDSSGYAFESYDAEKPVGAVLIGYFVPNVTTSLGRDLSECLNGMVIGDPIPRERGRPKTSNTLKLPGALRQVERLAKRSCGRIEEDRKSQAAWRAKRSPEKIAKDRKANTEAQKRLRERKRKSQN